MLIRLSVSVQWKWNLNQYLFILIRECDMNELNQVKGHPLRGSNMKQKSHVTINDGSFL